MRTLADAGVSTAIFAPAWTHEHFSVKLNGLMSTADEVSRSLWEGVPLPNGLKCDCKGTAHYSPAYQSNAILDSAVEYPAGSLNYFYSDFSSAFWVRGCDSAVQNTIIPRVGFQSISLAKPSIKNSDKECPIFIEDAYISPNNRRGESIQRSLAVRIRKEMINEAIKSEPHLRRNHLRLYNLAMCCEKHLCLRATYSASGSSKAGDFEFGLYTSTVDELGVQSIQYNPISLTESLSSDVTYDIKAPAKKSKLVALGVYCTGQPSEDTTLPVLHTLSVLTESASHLNDAEFSISKLRVVDVQTDAINSKRLQWEWIADRAKWHESLPWSSVSGPFSYFRITRNGAEIGLCQTLAFPLESEDLEGNHEGLENEITLAVEGICFANIALRGRAVAFIKIEPSEQ